MSRAEKLLSRIFLGRDISDLVYRILVLIFGESAIMGLLIAFVNTIRKAPTEAKVLLGISVAVGLVLLIWWVVPWLLQRAPVAAVQPPIQIYVEAPLDEKTAEYYRAVDIAQAQASAALEPKRQVEANDSLRLPILKPDEPASNPREQRFPRWSKRGRKRQPPSRG